MMAQENVLAFLRITYPDGRHELLPLKQSTINLGRSPSNEILLADAKVSHRHARLLLEIDRISLIDLNSTNGTFVGTHRLPPNEPHSLSYGETFRIGKFMLHLEPVHVSEPAEKEESGRVAIPEGTVQPVQVEAATAGSPDEPVPSPAPPANWEEYEVFGLARDSSRYMQYLPSLYQEQDLLGRFLSAFEGILVPIEQTVDNFDLYLDPQTTPAHFLDTLARWLGLSLDEKWPLDKRRILVGEAAELYRRRGTRWSLSRHLEIYADVAPEILEPQDRPHHFHVVLRVPPDRPIDPMTVERIIQANQPAHTTFSVEILSPA